MNLIPLLQALSIFGASVPASPYPEVKVAALECLEAPKSAEAAAAYQSFLDTFSYETINGKKPDPALLALIEAEVEQCAEEQSWQEESKSRARGWVLSRLLQMGAWSIVPLEGEKRDRLVTALNDKGEAGVAIAGLMTNPSAGMQGYTMSWLSEVLQAAELSDEDDEELGRALGVYLMATAMRRTTREKFAELNGLEEE